MKLSKRIWNYYKLHGFKNTAKAGIKKVYRNFYADNV